MIEFIEFIFIIVICTLFLIFGPGENVDMTIVKCLLGAILMNTIIIKHK